MKPEQQLETLLDGLRLLAASADEQVQSLPDYVCVTDELISNFVPVRRIAFLTAGRACA